MKIRIFSEEDQKKIRLALPTSLIKSNMMWKLIKKHASKEELDKMSSYEKICKTGYAALKKYIKENGHFVLVEVHSNDGDEVVIIV